MTLLSVALLFLASFVAGVVNPIAGGGTFFVFPALLLTGLDPRAANMTSTIALFPMQVGTGYAGRKLSGDAPYASFMELFIISLGGGVLGGILLLVTPSSFFEALVPWLILFATVLFAYGSFVKKPNELGKGHRIGRWGTLGCQFCISVYGGYFGGGIGFLMLAALTLAGMPVRSAGATKNILAGVMNAAAVLIFVFSRDIGWPQVGIEAAAAYLGGMIGVKALHVVNERVLRVVIVVLGFALTALMFAY